MRCTRNIIALTSCCAFVVMPSFAQKFPGKPLRIIVPQVAGGAADIRARQTAQKMSESFGQPVVIDNRPGANSAIGAKLAAKAAPDGYTLYNCNSNNALNDLLDPDPASRLNEELIAVTRLTMGPVIMVVHPSLRVGSMREFVELAKAKPRTLNYAHSGKGTLTHLFGEMLRVRSGADIVDVPYKSSGAQVPDVVGGHVVSTFEYFSVIGPHIVGGRVKALAVANARRLPTLPDTPTTAEAGFPNMEALGWGAICVPQGTPGVVINVLYREIAKALTDPVMRDQVISTGGEMGGEPPAEFAAFIRAYKQQWEKVIREAKISLQ
jgi:tripartite-type tricarboxylate transporter receptor subunit TctC